MTPEEQKPLVSGQGWGIYTPEQFTNRSARGKDGNLHNAKVKILPNWWTVDPWQRLEIYKLNYNVFSIVSQRAQIISGMNSKIVPSRSIEDEIAERLKEVKWRVDQLGDVDSFDIWGIVKKEKYLKEIKEYLLPYELKADLSNFDQSLRMWSKAIKRQLNASAGEIEDWLAVTRRFKVDDGNGQFVEAATQEFPEFISQHVQDMLVHGVSCIQNPTAYFDGLWVLPGGSVFPVPGPLVGDVECYIQLMYGMGGYGFQEPKFFLPQDVSLSFYLPNSALIYGLRPIDAIINQIMENFNFGSYMADHANNERPPEYVIFVVEDGSVGPVPNSSSGDFKRVDGAELERTEAVINEKQKDKAVRIVSQVGTDVKLLNLSKENTISQHIEREEQIKKIIGRAFAATPNEMGETDTGGMIAKSGAEAQQELYNRQAIKPLAKSIENQLTFEFIKNRFGVVSAYGGREVMWNFKYMSVESDVERFGKAKAAKESGSISINEIRESILGLEPTNNPEDDKINPVPAPQIQDVMNAIGGLKK